MRLLAPLLCFTIVARPAYAEGDTAGMAMAVGGGAALTALVAADDGLGAASDCTCTALKAVGVGMTCPTPPPWMMCATLAVSAITMIAGVAMMMSAKETENAVKEEEEDGEEEGEETEASETSTSSIASTLGSSCSGADAPAYLCDSDGLELLETDLNKLDSLSKTNSISLTPEQLAAIDKAKSDLEKLKKGNYQGILDGNGAGGSYSSDVAGSAAAATPGDISGDGSDGGGGTNGSVNWRSAAAAAGFGNGNTSKVGPTGAYLDKTEWNGALDMINPNTGKSLTLWERATRRYMGTPDGQRGFTLARIEQLRKQSSDAKKLAEARAQSPAKAVAKKPAEPTPYVPVVLSPKEFSKH